MDLSLSNSLVGGGSMNPDGLSLDLQFAADKSFSKPSTLAAAETQITSRRGPAPVFSRGTSATMVGSDGLIQYGPENLAFPSEMLTNAPTNVVLNRVSGDSIFSNPVFISETTGGALHRVFTSTTASIVGLQYIFQFYFKANGRNFVYFNGFGGAPTNTVDLSTGAFTNNTGWTSTLLGNGWYKIITPAFTATATSAGHGLQINIDNQVSDNFYTGDITKGVLFNGVQMERSSVARQYIPTTTGPVYGPRFDHDPVGRTNLLSRSEDFANFTWIKSNSSISGTLYTAPTGASTANELVEDSLNATHNCIQNPATATIGTTYTFSVFVKRKPSSNQFLLIGATNLVAASFISVNLTNGVTSTGIGSPGVPINVSSTAYPDGWYRVQFSVVATSAASTSLDIRLSRDGTWANRSYLGDGVQSSLIWGAQIEAGSFPTSYIPTTTAPVTIRDCKGLLIEEGGRTNALQHSDNFKNTTSSNYWENLSATTVTVDQTTSPDGGVNADLLTTSATAFDCFFRRANIWAGSTQYTYSVFLKQGLSNHRYVGLYIGVGVSALKFPFFDFNNPTVVQIPSGTMVGTINSTQVDAYPNGWYRVIVTFTTAATPATTNCGAYISASDGTLPASSAAGLDAYVWGIQSELGSFPTSYIPTTTASAARSADVCSITVGNFTGMWNQSEGTLLTQTQKTSTNSNAFVISVSDNSFDNEIDLRYNSVSQVASLMNVSNVNQLIGLQANITSGAAVKQSIAYKLNDCAYAANGASPISDTSALIPNVNSLTVGNVAVAGQAYYLNGHIAAIRYYKKRLPNAKLQTLTV